MNKNQNLEKAKKYVNKLLVPLENHYYHSYNHALEVMERAMYLAEKEGLDEQDIEMLGYAWLFHDTGFILQYEKNEPLGAKIAQNYLKSILYPSDRVKKVEKIILATDPDYKTPQNIYEKVIKDADMDNLGRDDFFKRANDLKKELEIIQHIKTNDKDWTHGSIQILKEYKYDTQTQKEERDTKKQENLKKILQELENKNI